MAENLSRREFMFRGGAAAMAAVAAGRVPSAMASLHRYTKTATVRVQLAWLKNVEFGGYWLADARGFYKQEAIQPHWLAGGPNLSSTAAILEGGQADIAVGDDLHQVVRDIAAGADLVVLGAVFQKSPGGLLSLPKNPIRTPKDILGKKIGVQQGATLGLNAILKIAGLPLNYTAVPVGYTPDPLIQGACDGYVCYVTNQPITLKLQGIPYVTALYADLGLPSYGDVIYTTKKYWRENRKTLIGFMRATLRGWNAYVGNPQAAAQVTVANYGHDLGLDPKQQQAQAVVQRPLTQSSLTRSKGLLWMSQRTVIGPVYRGYSASGDKNLPGSARFIDMSILEAALH